MKYVLRLCLATCAVILTACSPKSDEFSVKSATDALYARNAREVQVQFNAKYITEYTALEQIEKLEDYDKSYIQEDLVPETLAYLFGPLTERHMGGPKRDAKVLVDWASAKLTADGKVELTYTYTATWLLEKTIGDKFTLPLPFNRPLTFTTRWKDRCGDSAPDHQTESFYWYFWDPTRFGCDQVLGVNYQNVEISVTTANVQTIASYPQYADLLKSGGLENNFTMTFAFGYVEDKKNPDPQKDYDSGMYEYQQFIRIVRNDMKTLKPTETPILQKEYQGAVRPDQQIGVRFEAVKNGVTVIVKVVAAAEIDQMELFAKSYAHDHDGFFGWFGHSRVGSGFDAENFARMVRYEPSFYSITPTYQIIYWGGCNSYSYYSVPFFENKAKANPELDPKGTLGLDIISNGLPSFFHFNAENARMALDSMLNWERNDSYQTIVDKVDKYALKNGAVVLVNVLGDEDNTVPSIK
jgi:hypothetical protein